LSSIPTLLNRQVEHYDRLEMHLEIESLETIAKCPKYIQLFKH
jgi:hypothetical protein